MRKPDITNSMDDTPLNSNLSLIFRLATPLETHGAVRRLETNVLLGF